MSDLSLSIVVPAYNEEQRLPKTLRTLAGYIGGRHWKFIEVIVVDDGSSDRTSDCVAGAMTNYPWLRIISYSPNRGKGAAVREGMLQARGEWRLLSDADLSAPIDEVQKLLRAAHDRGSEIVIASRALDRSLIGLHQSTLRELAGRVFNSCVKIATGLHFQDTQCGFKLFSARSAEMLFSAQRLSGFGFDVEVLFLGNRFGFSIAEVPTRWNHVSGTKVSMFRDSLQMFIDLVRIRSGWARGLYEQKSVKSSVPVAANSRSS